MRTHTILVAAMLVACAAAAHAQQTGGTPLRGSMQLQSTTTPAPTPGYSQPRTLFTVDGTAVHVWTPVAPPYGSSFQELGGQPMRSGENLSP